MIFVIPHFSLLRKKVRSPAFRRKGLDAIYSATGGLFRLKARLHTHSVLFSLGSQKHPIAPRRTPRIKMLLTQLFRLQFLRIYHAVNPALSRNDQNASAPARLGQERDLVG